MKGLSIYVDLWDVVGFVQLFEKKKLSLKEFDSYEKSNVELKLIFS